MHMDDFFKTLTTGVTHLFELLELIVVRATLLALAALGAYSLIRGHP